jgi:ankyrin repeat protein
VAIDDPLMAERLLEAGARADGRMPGGGRIVPWAIRQGRAELVRRLLKAGADAHQRDRQGNPLLQVAIASGQRRIAEDLLALGADPGAINPAGTNIVRLAMLAGWREFIPSLILAGADPNAPDATGHTPLHHAVVARDRELCAVLLKHGADPLAADPTGETALSRAVATRDPSLLDVILRPGSGRLPSETLAAPLASAVRGRWREGMLLLAGAGAGPDLPAPDGRIPTDHALACNEVEMLGWLLSCGANPARRDAGGRLLVERAAAAGRGSAVKLLLDYGSPAGRALYDACVRQDRDMVALVAGCCPVPPGGEGPQLDSPLAAALRTGNDALAARVAAVQGAVNHTLPEGQTTLHLAIAKGCHRTVKLLLDAGADPNQALAGPVSEAFIRQVRPGAMADFLRRDRNLTPLMLAADSGVPQTVQHLLAAGGKRNVRTRVNRYWPINFAAQRGDVPVMRAVFGRDPYREERRLVISLAAQQAVMFDGGGKEIFRTKVSTGRKDYPTRTGDFAITDKNRTWTSTIYHVSMPYFLRLNCGDFGLHQGYVPGYPASHGCIRVPPGKAAELFRLVESGDRVQIIP